MEKCLIIFRTKFINGHSVLLPELAWSALLQAQGSHFFLLGYGLFLECSLYIGRKLFAFRCKVLNTLRTSQEQLSPPD